MKSIILAAGEGKRLRPYSWNRPKCMVKLAGKPLLHRQIEVLRRRGITNITVVGGYRIDELDPLGAAVAVNPRYDKTNMVATLFCAREAMLPGEDLLITYGDIVYEADVLEAALEGDGEVTLVADRGWRRYWAARMDDPLLDAETFQMTEDRRVVELGKTPYDYDDVQAQYMGIIRVRADAVGALIQAYDRLDRHASYDGKDFDNLYMTTFLQHLIDLGWDVRASLVENGWLEVDTAKELESYEAMAVEGQLEVFFEPSAGSRSRRIHGRDRAL